MKTLGAANTAAKLETARMIDGVPFDGSADIETGAIWAIRHPASPLPAARTTYYDKPDTAFANLPTFMDTGQSLGSPPYEDTGSHPFIAGGAFQLPRGSGSGGAAEYTKLDAGSGNQLTRVGGSFKLDPTGATTDAWTYCVAMCNEPILNFDTAFRIGVHMVIGSTGWGLSKVSNATGSLVFTFLSTGTFSTPLVADNNVEYTLEIWRSGNTCVFILPDGQRIQVTDSDIGTWSTRYGFSELVLTNKDTDTNIKQTELWYDVNGTANPVRGGVVTRDVLDNNTNPKVANLRDVNNNTIVQTLPANPAANYLGVANRGTGNPPYLYANGTDTNVNLGIVAKGTGRVVDGATNRPFAETMDGATVITTNTAPTRNRITRYDATAGNLAVTLPALSGFVEGDTFGIQKSAGDASSNTVTFTRTGTDLFDDGATTSLVLRLTGELRYLQVFSIGGAKTWKVVGGNTPLTSTDARYIQTGGNAGTATKLATARSIDGVPFDGSADIGTGIVTPASCGLVAWTFDPMMLFAGVPLSAGILYVEGIYIPKAGNITNLIINVMTAGSTLTSGQNFAALYQGGALLGTTADQTTSWNSTGLKTMAISGGPKAVTAGWIHVALYANGTTPPTISAAVAGSGTNTLTAVNVGPTKRAAFDSSHPGLTTAPPATLGTLTDTSPIWAAVS